MNDLLFGIRCGPKMLHASPSIFVQIILIFLYFITTRIPFLFISKLIANYICIPSDIALFGFVFVLIIIAHWLIVSIRHF